jgi:peptide/nickel transport system substrate-binding protein
MLAVFVIVLSGCGLSHSGKTAADGPLTNAKAIANLAQPPATPDPDAKSGGTLKLTSSQDPLCLDGGQVSTAAMQLLGRMIYDNLDALNAQGNPTPWLAQSWTISDNNTTYTFQLRKGVTFSDGTPFNAAAVVANFNHWRNPATKSPLAGDYIQPIKDTKIESPYTLRVDLKYPYSPFLNVLAQGWLGFVSPKQLATQTDAQICQDPIGTGPFVVDKYTQGEGLTLSKRKDYDWAPAYLNHAGPAYLNGIDISFVTEASVRYTSLVSGEYDATDNIGPQYASAVESNPDITYHNISRQGNPERIILNTSRAPFNNLQVRRALGEGINVDGIVKTVGYGQYQPEHSYLSPTTADYDPTAQSQYKYDPAAANKLLDEAGWSKRNAAGYRVNSRGQQFTAYFPVGQTSTQSALDGLIQSQFKALGIDLVLEQTTTAQEESDLVTGNYDVTSGVWHTNTPDALYVCYDGTQISTTNFIGQNDSRLNNPQLNAILQQARETTSAAQQKTLYAQAEELLQKLVPAIPLYDFYTPWAVRSNVHDVLADSSHGTPLFTIAWMS